MGAVDNTRTPHFRLSRAAPSSKTHEQVVKRGKPNRLRIDSDSEEDDGEEDHDEEKSISRVLFISFFASLSVAVETDALTSS